MTSPVGSSPRFGRELRLRLASAVVLVAIAGLALWAGGDIFAALAAAVSLLVMREWAAMSGPFPLAQAVRILPYFVAITVFMASVDPVFSLFASGAVTIGLLLAAAALGRRLAWIAGGLLYAVIPGVAAVVLRGPGGFAAIDSGFWAIAFVCTLVWATDTAAYFTGRLLGGPKLSPRFSPKKTWSGAIGGTVAALVVGLVIAILSGQPMPALLGLVAIGLSIAAQAGDIAESAMKRHFGVKDSGTIIPGHGGIMDRVDGLVVALVLAAAVGVLRAGLSDAGSGLLAW